MDFMILLLSLSSYVVTASSSLDELPVHPGVGGFYKGPNSETIIKGPDGSIITVEAEGGSILANPDAAPILLEDTVNLQTVTPVADVIVASDGVASANAIAIGSTVAPVAETASVSIASALDVGHTVEIIRPDPHLIETELVDAPVVEPLESTDLIGPSGSISTRGSSSVVSGPASTTISEPARAVVATPIVAAASVLASVKTPLRSVPVVEIVPDLPPPINSFVLPPTAISAVTAAPLDNEVSISPEITVSTPSPLINLSSASTVTSVTGIDNIVSTQSPEVLVSTPSPGLISSTIPSNVLNIEQLNPLQRQPDATVEAASSFGVIENRPVEIASTLQPDVTVGTTLSPTTLPELNRNSLNYAIINNGQLSINPALIPTANIIPPEIGLRTKINQQLEPSGSSLSSDIVLSSTETTVNIANKVSQVQENKQAGIEQPPVQIPNNSPGIPSNGLLGGGLAQYGIDASQINIAQVPLSSATRLTPNSPALTPLEQEIEDTSAKLWDRYGREVQRDDKIDKNNDNS